MEEPFLKQVVEEGRSGLAWGKCEDLLPQIPDNSIDSLVCDPPAGISFMGKSWDTPKGYGYTDGGQRAGAPPGVNLSRNPTCQGCGGRKRAGPETRGCVCEIPDFNDRELRQRDRAAFVTWLTPIMRECLRVVKPGGYGLIWSLPRTSHWTGWALEEAGWEIRDTIHATFSTGFPKSHNVSIALDKHLGAERPVVGKHPNPASQNRVNTMGRPAQSGSGWQAEPIITAPGSPEAAQWDGWGTALKPAHEIWWLVRKPPQGTVAENLLAHGVGALNIAACEIGRAADDVPGWHASGAKGSEGFQGTSTFKIHDMSAEEIQARRGGKGRWPSNQIFQHHPDCEIVGETRIKGCPATVIQGGKEGGGFDTGSGDGTRRSKFQGYGDAEGMEDVAVYRCVPGCAVAELARQSGVSKSRKGKPRRSQNPGEGWGTTHTGAEYDDAESAARFFHCPKPSKREKQEGLLGVIPCAKCGGLGTTEHVDPESGKTVPCLLNDHATIKPVTLMRYLVKLICPPGGVILDPFLGSGTTGVAAVQEGMRFVGIEMEERSYLISQARILHAREKS